MRDGSADAWARCISPLRPLSSACAGARKGVPGDFDQRLLRAFALARIEVEQGHVGRDRKCPADVVGVVHTDCVEAVHRNHERDLRALEVVDREKRVRQATRVDEDDGADRGSLLAGKP